jgi:hypothetical protein
VAAPSSQCSGEAMARFLFVWSTSELPGPIASPPDNHVIVPVDQYELDSLGEEDFAGFDGMILCMHADQRHLVRIAPRLNRFLETGSILVNGPVAYPFLPQLAGSFEPLHRRGVRDMEVAIVSPHPAFVGVEARDLTFRRGVAGFWGRGRQPAPAGAEILTVLGPDRVPFDWCLVRERGGRLFVHPGNCVWTFAGQDTSAGRVWPQLLAWLGEARVS